MIILQQTRGLLSSNDQLSLDLQFAADKSFSVDPNIAGGFLINSRVGPPASFSRSSGATVVNSSGVITYAPENLAWWSESLATATTWTASGVTVGSGTGGPNNSAIFQISETATTASHFILNRGGSAINSTPIQQSVNYTTSVFLNKVSGSVDWVQLALGANGFSATSFINVNISNGTFGFSSGLASGTTPQIESFPNGWYRVSFTATSLAAATASNNLTVALTNNTNTTTRLLSYAGNVNNKILVTMAQFQKGNIASNYILTTSSARYTPRFDHNPTTLASGGLLIEESRTNLSWYSGALVNGTGWGGIATSSVSGTGPDGNTSYQLSEFSATQAHTFGNTGGSGSVGATSVVSGTVYTGSIFLKKVVGSVDWVQITLGSAGFGTAQYANFNISNGTIGNSAGLASGTSPRIEGYGNGWYRCSISVAATATTTSLNTIVAFINNTNGTTRVPSYAGNTSNSVLAAMCQFEVGSFVTSYIPTTTGSVIRAADVCNITSAAFTSFYNSVEGTLFANAASLGVSSSIQNPVVSIESGTSQVLRIRHLATTNRVGAIVSGVVLIPSSGFDAVRVFYKSALSAGPTGADFVINGTQIPDTFTGSSLSADNMKISVSTAGLSNTIISSIRYYKKRFPVPKLQALTA